MSSAEAGPEQGGPGSRGRLAGRAARASLWSVASQVAQTAIGLVGFWILSRYLGPHDYGLVGMASTAVGMLGVFGEGGVVTALTRAATVGPVEESSGFWLAAAAAAGVGLACAAAAPLLGLYFQEPRVAWLGLALAASFLCAMPGRVASALLSRQLRQSVVAVCGLASSALALAGAWWSASRGGGPWALVLQLLLAPSINSLVLVVVRRFEVRPRLTDRGIMRTLGAFSWRLSLFNFIASASRSGDVVLGGRLMGPAAPGLLGMATRLGYMPVQRLVNAIAGVFLPTAVGLEGAEAARAYSGLLRMMLLVVGPFCGWMVAAAPELLSVLPARWAGLEPVVRVIAVGAVLEPVGSLAWALVAARGRADLLLRFSLYLFPIAWGLSLVGAMTGTPTGLAAGWALTNTLNVVGIALLLPAAIGVAGFGWRDVTAPLAASAAIGLGTRVGVDVLGIGGTAFGLLTGLAIAGVLYAAALNLFFRVECRRATGLVLRRS